MGNRRRNYFIKKGFQAGFAAKFLILIAIESVLAIGFFVYLTSGSVIMHYSGSDIVMAGARGLLLPPVILANLAIIAATAIAGFAMLIRASHKIAGPLYRFERSLETISKGDLTHRFSLRGGDELKVIEKGLLEFTARFDSRLARIQKELLDLDARIAALDAGIKSGTYDGKKLTADVGAALERIEALKKEAGYFKTTVQK